MENTLDEFQIGGQGIVYASFGRRFVASLLDGIILYFINMLIMGLIGLNMLSSGDFDFNESNAMANVLSKMLGFYGVTIITHWLYFAFMESSEKQGTVGKMALGIKVISSTDQGRPTFGQASGRHFGKIISAMILGIGYLMMLWSNKSQTLHDTMAGCEVIRK
jgi:uncharacterized RDD family membrane protein YckC